jgi:hypothetical protein
METKKYTSYAEIDRDLEILKLEREIQYKKVKLSVEKIKDDFSPSNSVSFAGKLFKNSFFRKFRNRFTNSNSLCN